MEVFYGTSLMVQLFWVWFVLPRFFPFRAPPLVVALLVIGLNGGAYLGKLVESELDILESEEGLSLVSRALGLTRVQMILHVLVPRMAAAVLPNAKVIFIEILKGTALASMIFITEATKLAMLIRASTGATFIVFGVLLAFYFVLAFGTEKVVNMAERAWVNPWYRRG